MTEVVKPCSVPDNVKLGWILQCPKHGTVEAVTEYWTSGTHWVCTQCQSERRAEAERRQRKQHDEIASGSMLIPAYWEHMAPPDWPNKYDDSYKAFENCKHPDCARFRGLRAKEVKIDEYFP